jgi:hypothetical protein
MEGLRQGLRQGSLARVAQIFSTVTLAGEPEAAKRFIAGITSSVEAYEKAWKADAAPVLHPISDNARQSSKTHDNSEERRQHVRRARVAESFSVDRWFTH